MALNPNILFDNRYRLIYRLGRGSFGEVWRARDEVADLEVAIKIYIALDESGLQDFRQEFRIVHDLHHPNLLRPDHYDISDSRPYLVMPLCNGSVEKLSGNMEERDIWVLVNCVAKGLDYLHGKDILHRDVKPDNILMTDNGEFLLSDFGVSKKLQNTIRRNSTRQMNVSDGKNDSDVSGTIPYMAPELFSKTPNAVKATDIWAFGVTLFELMTGELLFSGQGGLLQMNGAEIPDLPSSYSHNLKALVLACLEYQTWDRPTASQLADYSDSILKGSIVSPPWEGKFTHRKLKYFKFFIISFLSMLSIVAVFFIIHHYRQKRTSIQVPEKPAIVMQDTLQQEQMPSTQEENTDASVPYDPAISTQGPNQTGYGQSILQLDFGEWHGGIKDGKPDGKGVLKIRRRHSFNGTQAEAGYRLEGTYVEGVLVVGRLYDESDNLIKTIMP